MAKKNERRSLFERMEKEMAERMAEREERAAKAKINWRKKLKLRPWQRLTDVELPDEYFESQLIKIQELDFGMLPKFKIISEIIAMSNDYEPYSEDWDLAMKYMYEKFQLPNGGLSPLVNNVTLSMLRIAEEDAREKRTKSMKEWRETMESLTEKLLPQDVNKIEMKSQILSLKLKNTELESKLKDAERLETRTMKGTTDKWHAEAEPVDNAPDLKRFTVRQTAIIAYALCRKGGFIPKNKKSISPVFQDLTGRSANTLGANLCSTYTDDEIEKIASLVEKNMPEFADYLREKTFFLPEIKK